MPKAFPGAAEPLGQREQSNSAGVTHSGESGPFGWSSATTGVSSAPGQEVFSVKRETEAGLYPHLAPLLF